MQAAPDAQLRLLELQRIDTETARLEHRKRNLPEHVQIAEAQRVRGQLGEALVAARTRVSDLEVEQEKAEADLVPVRERLERDRQRVDGGVVTDPKALTALIEEIAHLRRRINDLEDSELEVMERLEQAQSELATLQERRGPLQEKLTGLLATRDGQVTELDAELDAHLAARSRLVDGLPADLIELYERLRGRLGGTGAAALVRRRCSGCQLEATAADLDRYAAAGPAEVLRCEECNRILVRVAESGL